MAAQGQNEGFYVLDDFICKAVHAPSIPLANPANQGRNEGMSVIEELRFDAGKKSDPEKVEGPEANKAALSPTLEDVIRSEVIRVAALISTSADPIGSVALFQKLLLVKLGEIRGELGESNR